MLIYVLKSIRTAKNEIMYVFNYVLTIRNYTVCTTQELLVSPAEAIAHVTVATTRWPYCVCCQVVVPITVVFVALNITISGHRTL